MQCAKYFTHTPAKFCGTNFVNRWVSTGTGWPKKLACYSAALVKLLWRARGVSVDADLGLARYVDVGEAGPA
jgi:hypothetical protein